MSWFYKLLAPFQMVLKHPLESFIRLETSDDEFTMVTMDGSLLSFLKIEGCRTIIGEEEYKHIIEGATIKIGAKFDRMGHSMQVFFVRDPDRTVRQIEHFIKPSRQAADNMGLEVDDVFDERVKNLSKYLSYEESYFVLWTRPSVLTKNEVERAKRESKEKK